MVDKRLLCLLLILLVAPALLVACGSETTETAAEPTPLPYDGSADTELASDPVPEIEGDPEAGKAVFEEHCQECHSTEEAVTIVGPSLFRAGERLQLQYIVASIENPHEMKTSDTYELDMPEDLSQQLSAKELHDVVAYVSSLAE